MLESIMEMKNTMNIESENITLYNSTGTSIQWLWGKNDGVPNFALRRFVIKAGGQIGIHSHREEHEIYILSGEGTAFNDSGKKITLSMNDTLYVPPNEPHGYTNTGNTDLIFLCIIPLI